MYILNTYIHRMHYILKIELIMNYKRKVEGEGEGKGKGEGEGEG